MPVLTYPPLPLTIGDIVSSWGPQRARLASSRVTSLLRELLARIEAEGWVQAKASFQIWPVVERAREGFELSGGSRISSPVLRHHMPGADYVAVGVCTIGDTLEKRVSEMFASNDRLRGVMLDEIGTLMLFRLCDQFEEVMQGQAARYGLDAGSALSPGHDGFEISIQGTVIELAGGAEIGVCVKGSGMLSPRKSLSAIVGFGSRMPKEEFGERCERCAARERCPYRWPSMAGVTT